MFKGSMLLFFFAFIFCDTSFSQDKMYILQNLWSNDLNSYDPKEFLDKMFALFSEKLGVKEFVQDRLDSGSADKFNKKVRERIKQKNIGATDYYVTFSSELKLPTVNLGKFLFKNPPRSSKFYFSYHIYNGSGAEIVGDTIINRGCLSKAEDERGAKYFYSDYKSFVDDMNCHLEVIWRNLQEKQLPRKKVMMSAR